MMKCHGKKRAFFVVLEARDTATLLSTIKKYTAPGMIIMYDCWMVYNCLEEHGYWHLNVIHSKNLKDPVTSAHMNTIELASCQKGSASVWMKEGPDDGLSGNISLEESSEESWTGPL